MSTSFNFLLMSDKNRSKILSQGFWLGLINYGIFKFGLGGTAAITILGYLFYGPMIFDTSAWQKGSIGFIVGGGSGFPACGRSQKCQNHIENLLVGLLL